MIRLHIDWEFISPSLRVASGILEVRDMYLTRNTLLLQCKIKKESGCTGYKSIDNTLPGIHTKLFEEIKSQLDTMIDSFFQGVLLSDKTYCWINDSGNIGWETWAKIHDIDPEEVKAVPYSEQCKKGV